MLLNAPLIKARLIRRYKRFLADVELPDGSETTAHVANPGGMIGLADPGMTVWLSKSDDPKRKLKYSWELVETPEGALAGVNTAHPNRIVEEALRAGGVAEVANYSQARREVRYGANSRVDFLLQQDGAPDCWLEVKNVHLCREPGVAEFPDAVTARGAKHLGDLADMARQGARATMFYLIQRNDCDRFRLAGDIDPAYLEAYRQARAAGVEAIAYTWRFTSPDDAAAAIEIERPAELIETACA